MSSSISIFEMIKIGVGPSSSHTMGPWKITREVIENIKKKNLPLTEIKNIQIHLYGSLATTGFGHGTDMAAVMGLTGLFYETMDTTKLPEIITEIKETKKLNVDQTHIIDFDYFKDLVWHYDTELAGHPNTMVVMVTFNDGMVVSETYQSIGGGFIKKEGETGGGAVAREVPYDLKSSRSILALSKEKNISLVDMILENELKVRTKQEIIDRANLLFNECFEAIYRGITNTEKEFWGGMGVHKKANRMATDLLKGKKFSTKEEFLKIMSEMPNDFATVNQWVSTASIAVNEENASFGRIITAPTNGASGVMPGVLFYARCFLRDETPEKIMRYILVAGQIAIIFKEHATLSGAMGGCQAEVGVSAAMNAAALADWMGANTEQTLMAASIAMTSLLGLTCDPVAGLVLLPCIERNATASIKAVNSAYLALANDCQGVYVSLDATVEAMWEIAQDMNEKYRETAKGGLATSLFNDYPNLKAKLITVCS